MEPQEPTTQEERDQRGKTCAEVLARSEATDGLDMWHCEFLLRLIADVAHLEDIAQDRGEALYFMTMHRDALGRELTEAREALDRYESLEGVLSCEDLIFMQIQIERRKQRAKWPLEHDEAHPPDMWQALIVERMARAMPEIDNHAYVRRFVQIAALAVAALEARDPLRQSVTGGAPAKGADDACARCHGTREVFSQDHPDGEPCQECAT